MELRRPTLSDQDTILDMLEDFETSASAMDGCFQLTRDNYPDWVRKNNYHEAGIDIPATFVPYIQYVLFDDVQKAIGFLNLRLRLNDRLCEKGGHIGYSIRPSERGKGYGKLQLNLGVKEAISKNINPILVTCHTKNIASRAIIVANGGILEDIRYETERYWIHGNT